jgi:putative alpha-1,2-mannosidase
VQSATLNGVKLVRAELKHSELRGKLVLVMGATPSTWAHNF